MTFTAAIFDLDGVLVDTAKYHYLAWQELAASLGIPFTLTDNEKLKGVSRERSLEIILSLAPEQQYTAAEKACFAAEKNQRYIQLISKMDATEILPGVHELLTELKARQVKISLGSASKNAPLILEKTGLKTYFDAVIDGNSVTKAKPNPEVFVVAAEELALAVEDCVVFEDAEAGIEAAKAAKMFAVGVGAAEFLPKADLIVKSLVDFEVGTYF